MKILIICIFIIINPILNCKSQNDSIKGLNFRYSILPIIGVAEMPKIQVGVEYRFTKAYGIQVEYGIGINNEKTDTIFIKPQGSTFRFELRKYNNLSPKFNLTYWGCELFYTYDKFNYNIDYWINYNDSIGQDRYSDNFIVSKEKFGVNLKFGCQKIFWNRLILDTFTGLGVKNLLTKNWNREFDREKHFGVCHECIEEYGNLRSNSGVRLNFTLGLKIGLKL